jgi:hypothetical protein
MLTTETTMLYKLLIYKSITTVNINNHQWKLDSF